MENNNLLLEARNLLTEHREMLTQYENGWKNNKNESGLSEETFGKLLWSSKNLLKHIEHLYIYSHFL